MGIVIYTQLKIRVSAPGVFNFTASMMDRSGGSTKPVSTEQAVLGAWRGHPRQKWVEKWWVFTANSLISPYFTRICWGDLDVDQPISVAESIVSVRSAKWEVLGKENHSWSSKSIYIWMFTRQFMRLWIDLCLGNTDWDTLRDLSKSRGISQLMAIQEIKRFCRPWNFPP